MVKVKICGITNMADAGLATRLGADMLGFNFYEKSPRYIEPADAAQICSAFGSSVQKVGIFVNENAAKVRAIADAVGLDAVQLHGDESPDYVEDLDGVNVIKAFRIDQDFDMSQLKRFDVDAILVDAFSGSEFGGTGTTCDWDAARDIAEKFPTMFLSGGLSAENVAEAIRWVRPFAVDACSSLEKEKGKKDAAKLEAFIKAAKAV